MDVLEIIKQRRSIRHFTSRTIPQETIDDLVEALRWAPSAGNLQSRKFYFIFDGGLRRKLAFVTGNPGAVPGMKRIIKILSGTHPVIGAPLAVVACLDRRIAQSYGDRGTDLYGIQDVAASLMNMMLAAHERGLGSVWLGGFDEHAVADILGLPGTLRPVAVVPVGYPAVKPGAPVRLPPEEAVVMVG